MYLHVLSQPSPPHLSASVLLYLVTKQLLSPKYFKGSAQPGQDSAGPTQTRSSRQGTNSLSGQWSNKGTPELLHPKLNSE